MGHIYPGGHERMVGDMTSQPVPTDDELKQTLMATARLYQQALGVASTIFRLAMVLALAAAAVGAARYVTGQG